MAPEPTPTGSRVDRRRFLKAALGGAAVVVVAGASGFELISHGVLPGKQKLDELDGACSVASPPLTFSAPGPSVSGSFNSKRRDTGGSATPSRTRRDTARAVRCR